MFITVQITRVPFPPFFFLRNLLHSCSNGTLYWKYQKKKKKVNEHRCFWFYYWCFLDVFFKVLDDYLDCVFQFTEQIIQDSWLGSIGSLHKNLCHHWQNNSLCKYLAFYCPLNIKKNLVPMSVILVLLNTILENVLTFIYS